MRTSRMLLPVLTAGSAAARVGRFGHGTDGISGSAGKGRGGGSRAGSPNSSAGSHSPPATAGRRTAPARPAARRPTPPTSSWSAPAPSSSPRSAATTRRTAEDAPKIVFVNGAIDGQPPTAAAAAPTSPTRRTPWTAYLAAYDPAVWGRATEPTGPLEDARAASAANQTAQIEINVGANTTIVGLGAAPRIRGVNLLIDRVDNVIVRNLDLRGRRRLLPAVGPDRRRDRQLELPVRQRLGAPRPPTSGWTTTPSPTATTRTRASRVYFGRPYQVHDGALDIIRGADHVTVSWNASPTTTRRC